MEMTMWLRVTWNNEHLFTVFADGRVKYTTAYTAEKAQDVFNRLQERYSIKDIPVKDPALVVVNLQA